MWNKFPIHCLSDHPPHHFMPMWPPLNCAETLEQYTIRSILLVVQNQGSFCWLVHRRPKAIETLTAHSDDEKGRGLHQYYNRYTSPKSLAVWEGENKETQKQVRVELEYNKLLAVQGENVGLCHIHSGLSHIVIKAAGSLSQQEASLRLLYCTVSKALNRKQPKCPSTKTEEGENCTMKYDSTFRTEQGLSDLMW